VAVDVPTPEGAIRSPLGAIRSLPTDAMSLDTLPLGAVLRSFADKAPDVTVLFPSLYDNGQSSAPPNLYAHNYAEGALLLLSDPSVAKRLKRAQAQRPQLTMLLQEVFLTHPDKKDCHTSECAQARMLGAAAWATVLYCQQPPLEPKVAEDATRFFQRAAQTPASLPHNWPATVDASTVCAAANAVIFELVLATPR
jgi:hypothetical protein